MRSTIGMLDVYSNRYTNRFEINKRQREEDLIGKYLVIVSSRDQNDVILYLQDERCGTGFWTKYMSNARGFYDESAAIVKAKNLQYNNPRVVFVQANKKLKEVYNSGKRTR